MAIYTIGEATADKRHTNGVTAIKVAAGIAYLGENIDLTAGEVTALTGLVTLTAGVQAITPSVYWKHGDKTVLRALRS